MADPTTTNMTQLSTFMENMGVDLKSTEFHHLSSGAENILKAILAEDPLVVLAVGNACRIFPEPHVTAASWEALSLFKCRSPDTCKTEEQLERLADTITRAAIVAGHTTGGFL